MSGRNEIVLGDHLRNTDGLKAYAKHKQLETAEKVNEAIVNLL